MVEIRALKAEDIQSITSAFAELGWNKSASQYEEYLADQEAERRDVLVATINGNFAGYLTIVWKSSYAPFQKSKIPEIVDFNVLPKFRRLGIGTQLMDEAEQRIMKRSPWGDWRRVNVRLWCCADFIRQTRLYPQWAWNFMER